MNGIHEKIEITEVNIEEMSRLAEDVMHQLYTNYQDYDADGRDIFTKYYSTERDYEKDIHPLIWAETEMLLNDPNAHLLYHLFRRADDIGHVRYYTKEDITPWIEPIIPKALNLFRKGTNECGDTNFVVAESVPDDYLIAVFTREVRNMMMIFAGQKLQRKDRKRMTLYDFLEVFNLNTPITVLDKDSKIIEENIVGEVTQRTMNRREVLNAYLENDKLVVITCLDSVQ